MNSLLLVAVVMAGSLSQGEMFQVPAGDAPMAVILWSDQSDLQILYDYPLLKGQRTRPLYGIYPPAEALRYMLIDTPAAVDVINERTVALRPQRPPGFCRPWLGEWAPLPPCKQMTVS